MKSQPYTVMLKMQRRKKPRFVVKSVEKSKKLRYYILARPEGLLFLEKRQGKSDQWMVTM